jgi:hypothetical protein
MSEAEAIDNADQFAANVMADRSRGNQPTIFDSKNPLVKTLTAFQLEVNNQYGYIFKDMPQDIKNKSMARLVGGYATMFLGAYAYNALYSSLTGRDAALDPIGIVMELLEDMGFFGEDEEEEPVDALMGFAENIAQELPFVGGLLGGGRVPISSALPYDGNLLDFIEGTGNAIAGENVEEYTKEWLNPLTYLLSPMAGGQIKKTIQGLSMFDEDLPVTGSYTNSGKLRFPVEDTLQNRIQAALFGEWSSENAREYFDKGYSALNEDQIKEYSESGLTIEEYRDSKNTAKTFGKVFSNGAKEYKEYASALGDLKADKDSSGKTISGSRKKKVVDYINGLDIEYGEKLILYKSEYQSDDIYNAKIVDYLNDRSDISYQEKQAILKELGATVRTDGTVIW